MRRLTVLTALVAIGWVGIGARPAQAYYDDVHYALTYYVARRVGYTPEQAFRVASACASVDYSLGVDPLWRGPLGLIDQKSLLNAFDKQPGFTPAEKARLLQETEVVRARRVRLHAFYDEKHDPEAIGDVFDTAATDFVIDQLLKLVRETAGNPGVSLHFVQDQRSHLGYGSIHGTWPILDDQQISKAAEKRMPIGGSIDWLSFDRKDSMFASHPVLQSPNTNLVLATALNLGNFLEIHSPRQKSTRALPGEEVSRLLQQLEAANEAPRRLGSTDATVTPLFDVIQFGRFYAKINADRIPELLLPLFALTSNSPAPALTELQKVHFPKQILGPDLAAAMGVINAAMREAGMVEPSLPLPRRYPLDEEGRIDAALADMWVLTGTLKVRVMLRDTVAHQDIPARTARVVVKAPQTMNGETEQVLAEGEVTKPGEPVEFEKMPVGKLIVEVSYGTEKPVRTEVFLDAREKSVGVFLGDRKLLVEPEVSPPANWPRGRFNLYLKVGANDGSQPTVRVEDRITGPGPVFEGGDRSDPTIDLREFDVFFREVNFETLGSYVWHYTVSAPGYPTITGEMPIQVVRMQYRLLRVEPPQITQSFKSGVFAGNLSLVFKVPDKIEPDVPFRVSATFTQSVTAIDGPDIFIDRLNLCLGCDACFSLHFNPDCVFFNLFSGKLEKGQTKTFTEEVSAVGIFPARAFWCKQNGTIRGNFEGPPRTEFRVYGVVPAVPHDPNEPLLRAIYERIPPIPFDPGDPARE